MSTTPVSAALIADVVAAATHAGHACDTVRAERMIGLARTRSHGFDRVTEIAGVIAGGDPVAAAAPSVRVVARAVRDVVTEHDAAAFLESSAVEVAAMAALRAIASTADAGSPYLPRLYPAQAAALLRRLGA